MSRAGHIATAKRVVGIDKPVGKKAPPAAADRNKTENDENEDVFLKKITKWSDRDRSNWTNDKRPSHRNLTIGAARSQGALQDKNTSDLSALKGLEESLTAMETYMREGNRGDNAHAADVTETMSDVKELLRIRDQSKQRARETAAKSAHEPKAKGPMFQVDEAPPSPGMYRPIKPFDPDNLESVRRHQQFLDRQEEERRRRADCEKQQHNFHALPMPGHVPFTEQDGGTEEGEREETGQPEPPDSLVDLLAERGRRSRKKEKEPTERAPDPGEFKAFFITEGDHGAGEPLSEESGGSSEESNDDDIDAELEELTKREKEILKSYTKLSRQRDRAAQAAAALQQASEPSVDSYTYSTPRQSSAPAPAKATPRTHTPGATPRRPTSTDVLMKEVSGGVGPSILDLDQKEREVLFKLKKEQKLRELKLETEMRAFRDLQRAPNISGAQESWRRAKEEHSRETFRQQQHEQMKQQLADMQEVMRIMRLEQKVNELRKVGEQKALKDKLRDLVQAGMADSTGGSTTRAKKKKRRKRGSSVDKAQSGTASVFTESTGGGPESSLAEDSSMLGLMTDSLVQGDSAFGADRAPPAARRPEPKKTRRNRLPPRGPSLAYSQFEAQDPIPEESSGEEEEGWAQRSALDLLSEEPSCVEAEAVPAAVPAQRSFVSRGGRRKRDQYPSIAYAESPTTALHQESTITYESESDLVPDSGSRRVQEGVSMFSVGGGRPGAARASAGTPNRDRHREGDIDRGRDSRERAPTPTKRRAAPSPYGEDLAAAYDGRHQGSAPKGRRRAGRGVDAARSSGADEPFQRLLLGEETSGELEGALLVKSPSRSRPKLREYSSPHRHIFDADPSSPPTVGSRPGWSEAEPDLSSRQRGGVGSADGSCLRGSGASAGVRSSRASTDLYLSDSESVISYDVHGRPQTATPQHVAETAASSQQLRSQPAETRPPPPARPEEALPAPVVRDPRYRHIDVYQRAGSERQEESAGYTFVPRPSSAAPQDTPSRPGSHSAQTRPSSSHKAAESEALDVPRAPTERPGSAARGDVGERFFDSSSTQDKGRFRVNDARDFHTKSMHRRPDTLDEGVTLLLGVRRTHNTGASGGLAPAASQEGEEEVITVLFDRSQFSEDRARAWWQLNKERILNISKFR